jgi:aspartate/methionine/tyrosine aminotransferase
MLTAIPGVQLSEPKGAFYCFPDVRAVLGKTFGGRRPQSSAELAELCLEVAKVAVVPGEAFGAPGYFRLSYAMADDAMVEGVSRIGKFFAEAV